MLFQGRKVTSQIAHRSPPGIGKAVKAQKPAALKFPPKNKSYIAMAPAFEKLNGKRPARPKGTAKDVPLSRKTWCEFCADHVTDVPQHNQSAKHGTNCARNVRWKYCTECRTAWQESQSHVCGAAHGSEPMLPVHVATDVHVHHCDACGLDMANDANTVRTHNLSSSHKSMRMMRRDSDVRPDGGKLASVAAAANSDKIWVTVRKRNGEVVNKLVSRGTASAGPASAVKCKKLAAKRPAADLSSSQPPAGGKSVVCCACGVHRVLMLADVIDAGGAATGASAKPRTDDAAGIAASAKSAAQVETVFDYLNPARKRVKKTTPAPADPPVECEKNEFCICDVCILRL